MFHFCYKYLPSFYVSQHIYLQPNTYSQLSIIVYHPSGFILLFNFLSLHSFANRWRRISLCIWLGFTILFNRNIRTKLKLIPKHFREGKFPVRMIVSNYLLICVPSPSRSLKNISQLSCFINVYCFTFE